MDAKLAAAYERVKDRIAEDAFLARIEEERAAFDGLLDDDALALLVLDEMGANDGAYLTISQAPGRAEATVRAQIEAIETPREFPRGDRAPGRMVGCTVSDATGKARLVLWDRDVEKTEDGTLYEGARLTVVNARVKDDRWGLELHVSPWSVLEVEGALDPAKKKLLEDVADDGAPKKQPAPQAPAKAAPLETLEGELVELAATRPFRGEGGAVGFVCDADIQTPEGLARVVLWNAPVRAIRAIEIGRRVRIGALARKPKGASEEWHTTDATTVEPIE